MAGSEVSNQSWNGSVVKSLGWILLGLSLFLSAFPLLVWNEGRAVARARSLKMGRERVLENVSSQIVDPNNEGQLVHMTGKMLSGQTLVDERFGVECPNAISLDRIVEMFQYEEQRQQDARNKVGKKRQIKKSTIYKEVWSETAIDSSKFLRAGASAYGNGNPPMTVRSRSKRARQVRLGQFKLNEQQVKAITSHEPVPLTQSHIDNMTDRELADSLVVTDSGLYRGRDPRRPEIGDLRIRFEAISPKTISIAGQQQGDEVQAYPLPNGSIELIAEGQLSIDQLFSIAESNNRWALWLWRVAGYTLMTLGIGTTLRPLAKFTDALPLARRLVGAGVVVFSAAVAGVCFMLVISFAWIFFRPLLALGSFTLAAVLGWLVFHRLRSGGPEPGTK